ncbi:DUF7146 domain-containing protein [Bradyrhizobium sp. 215_C5_N1_1]|uniref:DUF7146 domain-containing protein n=1 Tax=unclassified Bradyrhizobium TaxID=2631580 RepID=UPI003F8CCC5F
MRILAIRPGPPGSTTLARFDLELNDHLKLFNLGLRQRGDEPAHVIAPNAFQQRVAGFSASFNKALAELASSLFWSSRPIMSQSLKSIAHALGGDAVSNRYVLCPGPGHSRKDRSLKVKFRADGTFSVTSFAGDDWQQCKDHVRERLHLPNDWRREPTKGRPVIRLSERDDDEPARIRSALQRWARATPISGTLAEAYLSSRGLTYSGDAIRFRTNDRTMVALMTDAVTNEPCGAHVTYLDGEGRKIARKMYGKAKGAVVRLSDDTDVEYGLGIGEGLETCLATSFAPIWACLSAGTMSAFPLLGGVECLTVFADNDASGTGIKAAKTCAERWHAADREATIRIPVEVGVDYATRKEVA